ncbi:hypothetical protein HWV62_1230 [Athelia sp. TMB]|nr:hypothetical protein HWV62_5985 [Athelia sp. TMB]KAF7978228.1 hypothetical protein HWV62_1230 [Athelia sp. TMB]
MPIAEFPVEIFDIIIDQVHYAHVPSQKVYATVQLPVVQTNSTLATCALVCRHWLRHSRALQFKSVDLTPRPLDFYDTEFLTSFLELLRSQVATITPHIQHIKLYFADPGPQFRSDLALLSSFVAIGTMSLELNPEREYMGDTVKEIVPFLRSLSNLKKLELISWKYETLEQLQSIVYACHRLEDLDIVGGLHLQPVLETLSTSDSTPTPPSLPTSLRALKASSFSSEKYLLPWLVSCAPSTSITNLDLNLQTFLTHKSRPSCGRLLQALASSLEHLTIEHRGRLLVVNENLFEDINLQVNDRLKTITFTESPPKIISAIINQISSPNMKMIDFSVPLLEKYWQDIAHFGAIDLMLHRPVFSHLYAINIDQRGVAGELSADTSWIQKMLPRSVARDIVKHDLILI